MSPYSGPGWHGGCARRNAYPWHTQLSAPQRAGPAHTHRFSAGIPREPRGVNLRQLESLELPNRREGCMSVGCVDFLTRTFGSRTSLPAAARTDRACSSRPTGRRESSIAIRRSGSAPHRTLMRPTWERLASSPTPAISSQRNAKAQLTTGKNARAPKKSVKMALTQPSQRGSVPSRSPPTATPAVVRPRAIQLEYPMLDRSPSIAATVVTA